MITVSITLLTTFLIWFGIVKIFTKDDEINDIGISYRKQFHIFLAVLIIFNYSNFRKYTNLKETSDLIIK